MKVVLDVLYLLILILIKIGDSVLFVFETAFHNIIRLFKKISIPSHVPKRSSKTIKKHQVLFKAKKVKKKRPVWLYVKRYYRKQIKAWRKIGKKTKFAFSFSAVGLSRGARESIVRSKNAFLWALKMSVVPIVALYRLDKNSREIFILEQARLTAEKKYKKRGRKKLFWYSIRIFVWGFAFSAVFIFLPLLSLIFLSDLPNPSSLSIDYIPKTTKIFDRNGVLLYEIFATQNRTIVPLSTIPKNLQNATIAIEDRDFYTHPGFDVRGIIRALFSNAQSNDLQGGSTITQQLIKSGLLTPDPTIERKAKEIILAFWAERIYNKEKILEMYFNYVPYGGTAWGIQAASDVYFGKKVQDLSLAESAFLAGLPRAPSVYSPYSDNSTLWKKRQKEVLTAMVKTNYITSAQMKKALSEKLTFVGPKVGIKAPHFVMYVKNLLIQKYGLSEVERGGLQVKTSLDLSTQKMVQDVVTQEVENDAPLNISNGASVVLDPKNGDILAMVGSRDYFDENYDGNVNLVTSLRQPGSTIKVVTYSLALSSGFTQATLLDDSPLTITPEQGPPYTPVNYDGQFHGRVPLRLAFANSFNITAVRVAQQLGVTNIAEQGKRMGITTWTNPEKYGLSITLGGAETTMLDLATVYSTVANSGKRVTPDPILEVKDSYGNSVYKKQPMETQVLEPGVAFIISDILSDDKARSMEFGANSPLHIPNHRVSVKTGTTDNKRDNWTVGFTPNLVVATWVGNNDNTPMSQALASGITGAAPMWNKIMTNLLPANDPPLLIPGDVVKKPCSGFDMYFLKGTENASCRFAPTTPTPTPRSTALLR